MTFHRCEIFYVKQGAQLRWKWRSTATGRPKKVSTEGYALFYDCLSAARGEGFTPTYPGMRLLQPGDPSAFNRRAS